jgi:hypothetical protein
MSVCLIRNFPKTCTLTAAGNHYYSLSLYWVISCVLAFWSKGWICAVCIRYSKFQFMASHVPRHAVDYNASIYRFPFGF